MRYSEFEKKIEELGFTLCMYKDYCEVRDDDERCLGIVDNEAVYKLDTEWYGFTILDESIRRKLFDLLSDLASTPLEDRIDKPLYEIVLELPTSTTGEHYLYYGYKSGVGKYLYFNTEEEHLSVKNILKEYRLFTMDEIEEYYSEYKPFAVLHEEE